MTDGKLYYSANEELIRVFKVSYGSAVSNFRENGTEVGIISFGRANKIVKRRAKDLGINRVDIGVKNKKLIAEKWIKKINYNWNEVATIGYNIQDLELLKSVGFSACPSHATPRVSSIANLILNTKGGGGCVREFSDFLEIGDR